ncbi:response regulator [Flavobacterium sp.]|uniref:response regulator n=1 Tax=Flavobacterium sp. TaxID=239 RepID=UPI0026269263|nr:response regulator transcription factor [Flavobacterium sp.]
MPQNINVLIVDDHPFIIQGYQNVITRFPNKKYEFTITKASDCKSGYETILNQNNQKFDIAFLDISMPVYEEKNIQTGEDLAKILKEISPDCKIVLLTMHSERLKVEKIIEEINPIGLVIKNDLTFDNMLLAIDTILKDERYYSESVIKFLNNLQKEKVYVDVFDRQILHFLSKGIKADDVALYIPLSSSSVRNRIENMKELIGKKGCKNDELINEAKENGMMLK